MCVLAGPYVIYEYDDLKIFVYNTGHENFSCVSAFHISFKTNQFWVSFKNNSI